MRLLRLRQVADKTGLDSTAIYRRMQAGEFPRQVQIGPNTVAWLEHEIDDWIQTRPRPGYDARAATAALKSVAARKTKRVAAAAESCPT